MLTVRNGWNGPVGLLVQSVVVQAYRHVTEIAQVQPCRVQKMEKAQVRKEFVNMENVQYGPNGLSGQSVQVVVA